MFIPGDDQSSRVPLGAGAHSLVDGLDQSVALADVVIGVLVVGRSAWLVKVVGLQPRVLRKIACINKKSKIYAL